MGGFEQQNFPSPQINLFGEIRIWDLSEVRVYIFSNYATPLAQIGI